MPYPDPQVRAAAFEACLRDIFQRGTLYDWEGTWRQIMHWAFTDQQQWGPRSDLVAKLLLDLLRSADKHKLALRALCLQLAELERRRRKPAGTTDRLGASIVALSWTDVELVQTLQVECKEGVDPRLVADFVRNPNEIRQAIQAFAQHHLKT